MYAAAADHESRNPHLLYEPEIVCWPTTTSSTKNTTTSSIVVDEKRSCSSTKCFNSSSKNNTNSSTRTHSSINHHDPRPYYTNSNDLFGYTFHRLNLCMENSAKSRKALQRFKREKKRLLKKHHHPRHPQVQKYDIAVQEDGEIVRRHHMHHPRADKKNTPTISFSEEAPAPEPANAYTRAEDSSIPATTSTAEYCNFMFSSIESTLSNPDNNTNNSSSSSSFLPTQKQVAGSSTTASISTANTPVIRNHDPMTKADSSLDMLVDGHHHYYFTCRVC